VNFGLLLAAPLGKCSGGGAARAVWTQAPIAKAPARLGAANSFILTGNGCSELHLALVDAPDRKENPGKLTFYHNIPLSGSYLQDRRDPSLHHRPRPKPLAAPAAGRPRWTAVPKELPGQVQPYGATLISSHGYNTVPARAAPVQAECSIMGDGTVGKSGCPTPIIWVAANPD